MSTQRQILDATMLDCMGRPKGSQNPRLRRGADGYWRFRAYVDVRIGTEITRAQKTYIVGDMPGKREAERRMKEMLLEIDNRPRVIQAQTPMSAIFDAFERTHLPTLAPNSQRQYRITLAARIRPRFDSLPAYQCNTQAVQDWCNDLAAEGLRITTIHAYAEVLSSVFRCATDWGYLDENQRNPVDRVRMRSTTPPRELPALTVDEVRRLLAVSDSMSFPRPETANSKRALNTHGQTGTGLKPGALLFSGEVQPGAKAPEQRRREPSEAEGKFGDMIRIGLYCGLRIGEILFLRWRHVQPPALIVAGSRNRSKIDGATKSKHGARQVPLGPVVLTRPAGARDDDRVFAGWEHSTARKAMERALAAAGVPRREGDCWHILRRSHMTLMKRVGAGAMREQLGHASEATSHIYLRDTFDMHEQAVTKFAQLVIGGAEGKVN
jgi:integrase